MLVSAIRADWMIIVSEEKWEWLSEGIYVKQSSVNTASMVNCRELG
jgi:hypothetical protein